MQPIRPTVLGVVDHHQRPLTSPHSWRPSELVNHPSAPIRPRRDNYYALFDR